MLFYIPHHCTHASSRVTSVAPHVKAVQGNVDPAVLFCGDEAVEAAVRDVARKAPQNTGHILNLGHGVLVGTPESAVKHFFDVNRTIMY